MHARRKIGLTALAAAILLALVYGFMPRPVPVDVVKAMRGPMSVTVDEEGKTRVIDRFSVSAPVAGVMRRVELDIGDSVDRGQTLLQIEPLRSPVLDPRSRAEAEATVSSAEASLKAAQENVRSAEASADLAQSEFERIRELFSSGYTTQEKLDLAEAEIRRTKAALLSSKFSVDVARYELEAARTSLRYSAAEDTGIIKEAVAITSPIKGRVLKIHHESEGVVNKGQPLIEVGDPRALEVEIDVLSKDAVRIKPGMPVLFDRWGGDFPLEGEVRVVEPAGFTKISALGVEEQRVFVIADITTPYEQWEQLGDGYRVEAHFILWKGEDILQIPSSALFRFHDGWAAFVMRNGKAQLSKVKIGHRNSLHAEVLSGMNQGESVITHPDSSIADGTRVKTR